jgi:hypothetical protein
MRTTQLHTFEEVLTEGIHVDNESEPIKSLVFLSPRFNDPMPKDGHGRTK